MNPYSKRKLFRAQGLIYSGEITCPISDDTGVYLVVKQDEQSKSELLETLSLANDYNIHIEGGAAGRPWNMAV